MWLYLLALVAVAFIAIGCVCAAHIPGVRVLVGAVPPRAEAETGPEPGWDPDAAPCLDHGWGCFASDYRPHHTTDLPERTPAVHPDPPAKAVANDHRLEYDPPHALSSVARWTCSGCHATALRNGTYEYGSALDERCTAVAA